MQYKCNECNDTGSRDKSGDYLDCGHCDTAMQRKALNDWLASQYMQGAIAKVDSMDAWLIHQRALAMAPKQEAKEGSNKELRTLKEAAKRAGMANHFIDGKLRDDMFVIGKDFIERLHAELEKLCPPIAAPAAANGTLTDEQIMRISCDMKQRNANVWPGDVAYARAILASAGPDAALTEDAKRYRYLRNPDPQPERQLDVVDDKYNIFESKKLDDAIDAALSGAKGN